MEIYSDPKAYDTIQRYVEENFTNFITTTTTTTTGTLNIVIVGAHHGHEIQRFLDLNEDVKITAFEPVPSSFKILNETYKNYDNVTCLNLAVSDTRGDVIFHEVTVDGCGSLKKFINDGKNKVAKSFEVQCVLLKDIFPEGEVIDLLWADTQGTELEVLKGAANLDLIGSLFLEVTMRDGTIAYEGNCLFDELEDFLKPTHFPHSIGLDNENNNGSGNSFWVHNN